MYAALEAAKAGADVILADRSLIGRGGATVMAQMTVAVALGEQTPDHWEHHLADTLAAGRGLCDEKLAAILCEDGPRRIREMDDWKVGWAREDGHIKQVQAPGHDRPRCVYVDFLSTGPAVSKTLRAQLNDANGVRRIGDLLITDITVRDGEACGATALHISSGRIVPIAAKAVVIATGGLTRLYRRNSASSNMGGDGYALALRAGAELIDMEFVQFFPIGHLAPRLVGMDPIMWDPFRYKLGGKLLNAKMREFENDYASRDTRSDGRYVLTRDLATYAITKEVEADIRRSARTLRRGPRFSDQRHADPEFAAKADTGDRAIEQKIPITLRKCAKAGEHREHDDRPGQDAHAPETVRQHAEADATDHRADQCRRHQRRRLRGRQPKIGCDCPQHETKNEKIEAVHRVAEG